MRNPISTNVIVLLLLIGPTTVLAQPFLFISDVVASLQRAHIADTRLKSGSTEDYVEMMKDLLVYSNEIRQATNHLKSHCESKDSLIRMTALAMNTLYTEINENKKELVTFIEKTLNDPDGVASQEGTWSRKLSEIAAHNDELWRQFPTAIVGVTYAMIDTHTTIDGKHQRIKLTKAQVNQIRTELINIFGKGIANGPKGGLFPLEVSAAILVKFLNGGWQPSDYKQ